MKAYFDNMATTQVDPRVLSVMTTLLAGPPGNPHAQNHHFGRVAGDAVSASREKIAGLCSARSDDVAFAPSATIANNVAVFGIANAKKRRGCHVLVSDIEHASVLETVAGLVKHGFEIEVIPVGQSGIVEPSAVASRMRPETSLVSVMAVNNEVGTIQPIAEIGGVVARSNAVFHCDAAQAPGRISLKELALADILTFSSHKAYGPKGAAALVVRNRRERRIDPLLFGGGQEGGLFPGTVNVPAVVGFALAMELAEKELESDVERIGGLAKMLVEGLENSIGEVRRNGPAGRTVPHCLSLTFGGVRGETILAHFVRHGIAVTHGSACSDEAASPSHVLSAMGMSREEARGTLRFSPGRFTTSAEVMIVLSAAKDLAQKLGR